MIVKAFVLVFILIFTIETRYDFIQFNLGSNFAVESSLLEVIQSILLLLSFSLTIKYRKLILKFSNKFEYLLRSILIFILFYEEVSFLTSNINNFFKSANLNGEINIHNLNFLEQKFFNGNIDFLNISFSVSFQFLVYSFILFFLCFGLYLPFFKKYRILFLEKKYSIFFILYTIVRILSSFSINDSILFNGNPLISHEYLELTLYIILLTDTFEKLHILKKIKSTIN